ncbi:Putative uncharacterized protein [Moritella viscosa]|uniref:Uncharacterized protein n=1 Tax=Moritella viscosa TaxID=80854 RepID=A0A1L0C484_9GAMM|nr:Putative uncharacterized protein [Moritella viscosa]SHO14920.1 Putative uncharacterized protein [Moritella viscosa]SHO14968.1 Putative uncharacterized protein [Moritella viscosa]SHO17620.1 Putative uncharacterized protein [Moritella viscosa]SHO19164.1 Putative uncharacterized protein [Moritella viscosa]
MAKDLFGHNTRQGWLFFPLYHRFYELTVFLIQPKIVLS